MEFVGTQSIDPHLIRLWNRHLRHHLLHLHTHSMVRHDHINLAHSYRRSRFCRGNIHLLPAASHYRSLVSQSAGFPATPQSLTVALRRDGSRPRSRSAVLATYVARECSHNPGLPSLASQRPRCVCVAWLSYDPRPWTLRYRWRTNFALRASVHSAPGTLVATRHTARLRHMR